MSGFLNVAVDPLCRLNLVMILNFRRCDRCFISVVPVTTNFCFPEYSLEQTLTELESGVRDLVQLANQIVRLPLAIIFAERFVLWWLERRKTGVWGLLTSGFCRRLLLALLGLLFFEGLLFS